MIFVLDEVTLRNDDGIEIKRNSALVKRYNEQVSASVDAGPVSDHQEESQESSETETGKRGDECVPQEPDVC